MNKKRIEEKIKVRKKELQREQKVSLDPYQKERV